MFLLELCPAVQIVQPCLGVVIISAITEGVDVGDVATTVILNDGTFTPRIVAISSDYPTVFVGDGDNISQLILDKEIALQVIGDGVTVIAGQQVFPGTILSLFAPKVKEKWQPPPCWRQGGGWWRRILGI